MQWLCAGGRGSVGAVLRPARPVLLLCEAAERDSDTEVADTTLIVASEFKTSACLHGVAMVHLASKVM